MMVDFVCKNNSNELCDTGKESDLHAESFHFESGALQDTDYPLM